MDNKLIIINYLGKHKDDALTMHELSKSTRIPYATFHRTIQGMKDILHMKLVGKSKVITLNIQNASIKSYLTISSEEEKKEFLKNNPIISKIALELQTKDIVLLFGSYAKGSQRESSDIDFLIINQKGEKSISFSKYELLFKKKINPIFIKNSELIAMLREKDENIGKQALKDQIIINNAEKFWELVLHG